MIISNELKTNYTKIANALLQDTRLSLQAKGLAAYLLSLPANWKIFPSQVAKNNNISFDTLKKYLKELRDMGYLQVIQIKDEKGKFSKEVIYSFESQNINEALENHTSSVGGNLPQTEKFESINKDIYTNKENIESLKKAKKNVLILKGIDKKIILNLPELIIKSKKALQARKEALLKKEAELLNNFTQTETQAIKNYFAYRIEKQKQITLHCKKLIIKKLESFKLAGKNIPELLKVHIENNWTGLFDINLQKNNVSSKYDRTKIDYEGAKKKAKLLFGA